MARLPAVASLLTAILTAATGCRTPSTGTKLLDTQLLDYEDDLGMRPGVGREAVLGDIRGECIVHDGVAAAAAAQEAVYSIQLVQKHQDLVRLLDVAAGAQIRAINPGQALSTSRKMKLAVGTAIGINRYSLYLLVSARIRNQTAFIKNARLGDQQRALLATPSDASLTQFREQCGDGFLTGFATGGEFIALIELATDSDAQGGELRRRFEQAASEARAAQTEASLTSALRAVASGRKLRIWVYQRGGAGEAEIGLPDTVDDIMSRLRKLADSTRAGQSPRPLTSTFADYATLGVTFPAAYQRKLDAAQEAVGQMGAALTKLLDLGADLDYVLAHLDSFDGIDAELLQRLHDAQAAIADKISRIDAAGKRCQRDLAACAVVEGLAPPSVELPERRPRPTEPRYDRLEINAEVVRVGATGTDLWSSTEYFLDVRAARAGSIDFVTLTKSESELAGDDWRGLSENLAIPMWLVRDVYAKLGTSTENGWLEVNVWEDDVYQDDLIGTLRIPLRKLSDGQITRSLSNDTLDLKVTVERKE